LGQYSLESIKTVKHKMFGFGEIRLTYRYLAINTGSSISILITYIVFVTKLQKRQTPEKGFALFENDITGSEPTVKMLDT
jgi:hypothetical protein